MIHNGSQERVDRSLREEYKIFVLHLSTSKQNPSPNEVDRIKLIHMKVDFTLRKETNGFVFSYLKWTWMKNQSSYSKENFSGNSQRISTRYKLMLEPRFRQVDSRRSKEIYEHKHSTHLFTHKTHSVSV